MSQPANTEAALRGFLARILGWSDEAAVERALRSLRLSFAHEAALVLLGDSDLVPIAQALHRRTVGADRPFVVCDPRRSNTHASVRAPRSYESGVAAIQAARGGSLCVRRERMPHDFSSLVALVRYPAASVQLVLLADAQYDGHPFLVLPAPIRVPSLRARVSELPRIVDEYVDDAIITLSADDVDFTDADRTWVLDHAARTLPEIEKATLRLVAIRMSGTIEAAAKLLGMSGPALRGWIHIRRTNRRGKAPHAPKGRRPRRDRAPAR